MANALPHPNLFVSFLCVTMDFAGGGAGVEISPVPREVGD